MTVHFYVRGSFMKDMIAGFVNSNVVITEHSYPTIHTESEFSQ